MKPSAKRLIFLMLFATLILSLSACSNGEADVIIIPQECISPELPTYETSTPINSTLPEAEQRAFINKNFDKWAMDSATAPWSYAITDLDQNSRLEVLTIYTQGSGNFSLGSCWEMSDDFTALVKCETNLGENDFWPELAASNVYCYYDISSDTHYYIFEDLVKSDITTYFTSKVSLSLKNGLLTFIPLCSKTEVFDANGSSNVECYDLQGNLISLQDFEKYPDMIYASFSKSLFELNWTTADQTNVTATQESVQSTPQPSGSPVVITKNPSSEALGVGGKTWFIAHANNANSLTWYILSPDGEVYSLDEAMQKHPGLELEALEEDTIAVSNVPISLNGWGVQARFDGVGSYQITTPAYIYVGDFVSAYSSVINKYKAFPSSNKTPGYTWENNISELLCYADSIGYALKDMDKDGVPELLIAAISSSIYNTELFDLYTLQNGTPVQLAFSWPRSRMYMLTNNTVLNESSGGAFYHQYELRKIINAEFEVIECLISCPEDNEMKFYYHPGEYTGNPNAQSSSLSEAQFYTMRSEYEAKIYLPPLTKIY